MTRLPLRPRLLCAAILMALFADIASAQTSTGTIAGIIRDASGAIVSGAYVIVLSEQTGLERTITASEDGRYAVVFLTPGSYVVRAIKGALHSQPQPAFVQAGMSTTIDLVLVPAPLAEAVNVQASTRLKDDYHHVTGWVARGQIAAMPLNGRSVLEAVKVEPGLQAPAKVAFGRSFIAPLGAGTNVLPRVGFTRVTLDGSNIETPGTVGVLLQIPPDAVDQIQVSTASHDMSIGLATSGAVDVITRSGGQTFTVDAFSLYRDRRWSEFPGIETSVPIRTAPLFRRSQTGATIAGPVSRRAFFFVGYERHTQRDLLVIAPTDPELVALGGTFSGPYSGTLLNARVDLQASDRHRAFVRHTRDDNSTMAPDGDVLPSGWSGRQIRTRQTLASLATILSGTMVNELRASFFSVRQGNDPIPRRECPSPCIGADAPRTQLSDGGAVVLSLGAPAPGISNAWRLELADTLVWQKGPHVVRWGFNWEYVENTAVSNEGNPVTLTLWSPAAVRQRDPSITLPASLLTTEDILKLPLRSFTTAVGPGTVVQRGFQSSRRFHSLRLHAVDQWRLGSRLAVNAGLAWSFEPGVLNDDLRKPGWLAPLVGADRLDGPAATPQLSGSIGTAWTATQDGRTVVRAGIGRYADSLSRTVNLHLANERTLLTPLGTGRLVASGSNITWNGRRLNFTQPTPFTGADLMAILPAIRANLEQSLNPSNRDFSVVNLDQTKEGRNLFDPSFSTPRAIQATIGIARDFGRGAFASADVVWKRFSHTFINGIDYNRFFSAKGPVIPACSAAQRSNVTATCSNGSLFFDTTIGRARYAGLLLRVEKRFAERGRVLVSYALGSFVGSNGTATGTSETSEGRVTGFNNDDWSQNYGPVPTDVRHVLNVSGSIVGPAKIEVSFNMAAYSRTPLAPYIAGMDFNGDGTSNDLLPGTRINQFNRGLDKADLIRLVADYNQTYAGKLTPSGQLAPSIALSDWFEFGDNFFALDVRLARAFPVRGRARLSAFVDVFNVFNTLNLTGYSGNLLAPTAFGRPTARVGQAFGSGGPRAMQLGLRMGF